MQKYWVRLIIILACVVSINGKIFAEKILKEWSVLFYGCSDDFMIDLPDQRVHCKYCPTETESYECLLPLLMAQLLISSPARRYAVVLCGHCCYWSEPEKYKLFLAMAKVKELLELKVDLLVVEGDGVLSMDFVSLFDGLITYVLGVNIGVQQRNIFYKTLLRTLNREDEDVESVCRAIAGACDGVCDSFIVLPCGLVSLAQRLFYNCMRLCSSVIIFHPGLGDALCRMGRQCAGSIDLCVWLEQVKQVVLGWFYEGESIILERLLAQITHLQGSCKVLSRYSLREDGTGLLLSYQEGKVSNVWEQFVSQC